MFSVREVPWHKKGTIVQDVLTAADAIVEAGLDWEVNLRPVYIRPGGSTVRIPDKMATVRSNDNRVLGIVGKRYQPLQNKESFDFFDAVVADGEAKYETAGSLFEGKRIFITAKLPAQVMVKDIDPVDVYLLLSNSHDGSTAVEMAITPVRVVCANTLRMALEQRKTRWYVRHFGDINSKVQTARNSLGITIDYMKIFESVANNMADEDISVQDFRELLEELEYPTRAINPTIQIFENAPNLEQFRGTKWGAYNAVAEWYDWGVKYRTDNAQVDSILFWNSEQKNKVLTALRS